VKLLLDTDVCIDLIRLRAPEVVRRLKRQTVGDVGISSITLAELAFGAAKSREPERNRAALEEFLAPLEIAPFDHSAAQSYGALRFELESRGARIGSFDALIAAHALSLGASLVTRNVREFSRVTGLRLANWTEG
jgi:tRNA(fMet)-specific endonuclease VapC